MGTQPWIKLWLEARTDRKLDRLTDAQHRVWFNLLLYAAEQDDRGTFADDGMLAIEVSKGRQKALDATIAVLLELHIIEDLGDGTYAFHAFEERQARKPSDSPEAVAERMRRYRARKAEEAALEGSAVTRNGRNAVTEAETGTEEGTCEAGARDQSEPMKPHLSDSEEVCYAPLRPMTRNRYEEGEVEEEVDQTPLSSRSSGPQRKERGSYPQASQTDDPQIAMSIAEEKAGRAITSDEKRSIRRWVREFGARTTETAIADFVPERGLDLPYIGTCIANWSKPMAVAQ